MTHDEDVYSVPFEFKPERFLEEGGHNPEPDSRAVAFGFGRRWARLFLRLTLPYVNTPQESARVGNWGKALCLSPLQ